MNSFIFNNISPDFVVVVFINLLVFVTGNPIKQNKIRFLLMRLLTILYFYLLWPKSIPYSTTLCGQYEITIKTLLWTVLVIVFVSSVYCVSPLSATNKSQFFLHSSHSKWLHIKNRHSFFFAILSLSHTNTLALSHLHLRKSP